MLHFPLPPGGATRTLRLHGPNGFVRVWTIPRGTLALEVTESYDTGTLRLALRNRHRTRLRVGMDMMGYAGYAPVRLDLPPLGGMTHEWNLAPSDHWYDLCLTCGTHPHPAIRLAGHLETGRPSRSDPRLGGIPPSHMSKGHEA